VCSRLLRPLVPSRVAGGFVDDSIIIKNQNLCLNSDGMIKIISCMLFVFDIFPQNIGFDSKSLILFLIIGSVQEKLLLIHL
jgi:hypothetical protein